MMQTYLSENEFKSAFWMTLKYIRLDYGAMQGCLEWSKSQNETARSLGFLQGGDEPEEGFWRSGDDECLGPIVERNKKLRDRWKVPVRLGNMGFEFLEAQAGDWQHGTWCSLATLEDVLDNGGLNSGNGKCLLPLRPE